MGKQMIDLSFFKGKRIFITGNTGFKGTYLCVILNMFGATVYGYSDRRYHFYDKCELDNKIKTVIGDIRDSENLKNHILNFKPDIVFHLAAQSLVLKSYQNPSYTFETNVMGTVNLFEAILKCDSIKAVVNITTDKVYMQNDLARPYHETDRLCGQDPYSSSKSCSELITYSYIKSFFENKPNISIATARAGNVIGGGDYAENRLIPDCVKAAIEKKPIIIRSKASIRPWQHVIEPIIGYLMLAKALFLKKTDEASYNFGPNDDNIKNVEMMADLFCKSWDDESKWEYHPDVSSPSEAKTLILDSSKAKEILGWQTIWDAEKSIDMAVKLYKEINNEASILKAVSNQINEYLSYLKKTRGEIK